MRERVHGQRVVVCGNPFCQHRVKSETERAAERDGVAQDFRRRGPGGALCGDTQYACKGDAHPNYFLNCQAFKTDSAGKKKEKYGSMATIIAEWPTDVYRSPAVKQTWLMATPKNPR